MTFIEGHVAEQEDGRDEADDVGDGDAEDGETRLPDIKARLVLVEVVLCVTARQEVERTAAVTTQLVLHCNTTSVLLL